MTSRSSSGMSSSTRTSSSGSNDQSSPGHEDQFEPFQNDYEPRFDQEMGIQDPSQDLLARSFQVRTRSDYESPEEKEEFDDDEFVPIEDPIEIDFSIPEESNEEENEEDTLLAMQQAMVQARRLEMEEALLNIGILIASCVHLYSRL